MSDKRYPTRMPKDCIAAPMNPWIRTNDQPPTEMDACHNGWVLALAAYQSLDNPVRLPAADIVDWDFPVNCPELYPYWMPLPKLPEVDDTTDYLNPHRIYPDCPSRRIDTPPGFDSVRASSGLQRDGGDKIERRCNQCVICGQEMPEGDQVCGYCRRQHGY